MAEHKLTVQYEAYRAERDKADRLEVERDAALEEARRYEWALRHIAASYAESDDPHVAHIGGLARSALASGERE